MKISVRDNQANENSLSDCTSLYILLQTRILLNPFTSVVHQGNVHCFEFVTQKGLRGRKVNHRGRGMKCFYLMTHLTHFIYGYMALDI